MSVLYCEVHNCFYDTDFVESCLRCEDDASPYAEPCTECGETTCAAWCPRKLDQEDYYS